MKSKPSTPPANSIVPRGAWGEEITNLNFDGFTSPARAYRSGVVKHKRI